MIQYHSLSAAFNGVRFLLMFLIDIARDFYRIRLTRILLGDRPENFTNHY